MLNKVAALLFISAGVAGFGISAIWASIDYAALVVTNQKLQVLQDSGSDHQIQLLMHRENTHRINVGFEGCWMGLAGIIIVTGYLVGKK
jgi:hypothetical protein